MEWSSTWPLMLDGLDVSARSFPKSLLSVQKPLRSLETESLAPLFRLLPSFPLLGLEPPAFSLPIRSYTTGS